eukprot:768045-Hanusia_phi.AAC.2
MRVLPDVPVVVGRVLEEQLREDAADRPDIRGGAILLRLQQHLRRTVPQGDDLLRERDGRVVVGARQTKIRDLERPFLSDQKVCALDVAMPAHASTSSSSSSSSCHDSSPHACISHSLTLISCQRLPAPALPPLSLPTTTLPFLIPSLTRSFVCEGSAVLQVAASDSA